jgi:hypothetical protein
MLVENWTKVGLLDGTFDEDKEEAKVKISEELKNNGWVFVEKVYLTPFADEMDYSSCSYDVGVLVVCGRRKQNETF